MPKRLRSPGRLGVDASVFNTAHVVHHSAHDNGQEMSNRTRAGVVVFAIALVALGAGRCAPHLARRGQDLSDDVAESVARGAQEIARGANAVEGVALAATGDRR